MMFSGCVMFITLLVLILRFMLILVLLIIINGLIRLFFFVVIFIRRSHVVFIICSSIFDFLVDIVTWLALPILMAWFWFGFVRIVDFLIQ